MIVLLTVLLLLAAFWILAYYRLPAIVWTGVIAVALGVITAFMHWPHWLVITESPDLPAPVLGFVQVGHAEGLGNSCS